MHIKEIDVNFRKAQESVIRMPSLLYLNLYIYLCHLDTSLQNLDPDLSERIILRLNEHVDATSDAHLTIKSWRHVGVFFGIDAEKLDNFRSMSDVLRYLCAHTCHTVADLMQAIHHVQRYDVLSIMCDHILNAHHVPTSSSLPESYVGQCVTVSA